MGPTICPHCGWSGYSMPLCEHCGASKKLEITSNTQTVLCQNCMGKGYVRFNNTCGYCGGRGYFTFISPINTNGEIVLTVTDADGNPIATKIENEKDGDEMFGILLYRFDGSSGPSLTSKTTQEEAQLEGERLAAQFRGNIQMKTFFTITIINLRTGALIGSVSDAPPAITWGNSSSS